VLIVAKNEAHNLGACLDAVRWADERVVVVDPASRDATRAIALSAADGVIDRAFDDFASQRNTALAAACGDWVLSIDADERVTAELADEIRQVTSDPGSSQVGFRVPIRSVILGRPFAYSGTQHDVPLRLFRRDRGRWVGLVHETVELTGSAGVLRNAIGHRTIPNVDVFLEKIDHYTTLEARSLSGARRRFRTSDVTLRPMWTFFKLYVFKQGFRDGVEGFMFCALSGLSVAVRAWKLRELILQGGGT
jgi:glycosyltransferase involved in cell wall biosynthesis